MSSELDFNVCAGLLTFALSGTQVAASGDLEVHITDLEGAAVEHAVVVAYGSQPERRSSPKPAIVDQIDKTFVPHALAVEVGTLVNFPNSDDIRHHVYSFSEAKSFELPLYKGMPAEPVLFDRAGVAVLGCNIHDAMRAYIYIADSPYFAVSGEDGVARIAELPPGDYKVQVWHPRQAQEESPRSVELGAGDAPAIEFQLELKPDVRIERGPATRRRRY